MIRCDGGTGDVMARPASTIYVSCPPVNIIPQRGGLQLAASWVEVDVEFDVDAGVPMTDIRPSGPANEAYGQLVVSLCCDEDAAAVYLDRRGRGGGCGAMVLF